MKPHETKMSAEQAGATSKLKWPDTHRPVSPAPSDVSLKSDRSKGEPFNFKDGKSGWHDHHRPVSPAPSDVSLKSDRSKGEPFNFKDGEPGWPDSHRPVSPAPSDVSLKSDRSKGEPFNFKDGKSGWHDHHRLVSPAPSDVSLKSDRSKGEPFNFKDGEPGWPDSHRPVSPAPSDVSLKSDRSKGEPFNFKDGKSGFGDHHRPVSPAPSDVSLKSDRSKGEPFNFKDDVPGPPEIKRPVVSASRTLPQDDPLDFMSELSSPDGNPGTTAPGSTSVETGTLKQQKQLISALKGRFLRENTGDEVKNHPNQKNTEHIIREEDGREKAVTAISDIFKDTKGQSIRTVLTVGETGVGKSFLVQKLIKEWAEKKSFQTRVFGGANDEEVLFPLRFSDLNLMKGNKYSLVELLNHFLEETKEYYFEQFEVLFILDGLDDYQLPLDFKNSDIVTDIREQASVDVLLTNLIRGDLFPSARVWITSRPSAASRLLEKCVDRTTEIQYTLKHKLTADLKRCILSQHEEELKKSETDTELYEIQKNKEKRIQTYDTLFKNPEENKGKTMLMTGAPGVGKTFQTRKFMVDWAKEESNRNIDFILSFDFSKLNSRKDEVQSMTDLLHQSLSNDKQPGVCNYSDCKVAFVLDGLEKCELPLNFKKNKDLTDMEEPASMDVLLTNLIKGKLLPSALVWIVSQPSGVDKIPSGFIKKQIECRGGVFKQELTADLKKEILSQHKQELSKHKTDTELYKMKEKKIQTYDTLFQKSHTEKVQTLLMTGAPGVGKTFQTRSFMLDWAMEKSNRNIDFIVSFDFSKLNSRKGESQSMTDLLCQSLKDNKHKRACRYADCKVAVVLDGLEKCELPLDFHNSKDLTDMEEPASMDVLLTNLIKGKLLPSALLWIVSQPSGVDKVPAEYIQKRIECRYKDFRQELTADLKVTICRHQETELSKHESDTELYEQGEQNKPQTYKTLFHDSKNNEVRRVLMTGVPGVGKTLQTRRFMVDWAKGNSSKLSSPADLIVSFNASDLNSRKDNVQSMTDLLRHSLNDFKHRKPCRYDKCKVVVVLDGLEKCELPLDFENNKDLTDMEEPASMGVLLTNFIKGKLLPSALLWIVSQPSGVDKIPAEYIQKRIECRETLGRRQKLISMLRERFKRENTENEDMDHPNQKNTEHIVREDRGSEEESDRRAKSVTKVAAVSDIFKDTEKQKIRTVLTVGEADIGKTFHVQKFIKQWANSDKQSVFTWLVNSVIWGSPKDEEILLLLNFSRLNFVKDEKYSLVGLLNRFYKETKACVISNFEQFKVLFVLDGLDDFEPHLDFDDSNNLTDAREPASVDVLLTNLIRGTLFPSAQVWITSRPSATSRLPEEWVDRTTEIRCKPDIVSHRKLKTQLKEQFTHVSEGIDQTCALLNNIYTDLYIIEGERGEVNEQHEARQVQDAKFKPETQETLIKYREIFKPKSEESIRTVLTIGVAGIGKSFATMKYMLDWAEGTANEDIYYMFPLSFRELNLRKEENLSLEGLINLFSPAMKTSEITDYDKYKILIVLDGFDECRLDLDFSDSKHCVDVQETTTVNVLLTNLIQGNLLSKAKIWITSRPAASNHIPAGKVDRVTEVRGFNDEQKDEYFRKRISDKALADKILQHVKKSRSLYIMCHIPVFCWITSKVLEDFVERNQEGQMPKALTDMYIGFLLLQCRQANVKYHGEKMGESSDSCWNAGNQETIISLGKLAFENLEKGNPLFTEDDLTECGVDFTEAVVFSGLFTQIKREGFGTTQDKLFCFVHLSIQEFMAALYVSHTFSTKGENLLTKPTSTTEDLDFYKTAVDKALESKNGDWDLFLRFLLGLSLDSNQNLLKELLKKKENSKQINMKTIEYIKEKIQKENSDADKNFNLFHCLNELNDHSLVKEVKKYLRSETLTFESFSTSQWAALTYVLLTSDEKLDVFELKKYLKSETVLLGMMPVVKVSKTALLSWSELSEKSCQGLTSSVLSSASSNLTVLDLSHNDLLDSGVEKLADGLKSLHCQLEVLKLSGCQVTEKGCSSLALALESKTNSSLKQLDLSYNHPGVNGVTVLSATAPYRNMSLAVCFDQGGESRLQPGLKKYGADLTLDENTASRRLVLFEGNRKVKTFKKVEEKVPRPQSEDRFRRTQVFCQEGLRGFCYWEVEWKGVVGIAMAYRGVGRRWDRSGGLGCNDKSWSLLCCKEGYTAIHGRESKPIERPPCPKIGVLLDWEGGTVTYYSVTSGKLSLIHTFSAKFTEPLFPGFWFKRGSVTLCEIEGISL